MLLLSGCALFTLGRKRRRRVTWLRLVNAEMPARRRRQSALERTEQKFKRAMNALSWLGAGALLCPALMSFLAPPIVFPPTNYASNNTSSNQTATTTSAQAIQTKKAGNL